jgi:hypothetical protein
MKKVFVFLVLISFCQVVAAQSRPGKKPPLPKGYLGVLTYIPFGSTLTNVVVAEYTPQHASPVAYEKLPVAGECGTQGIRYYVRKYNESSFKSQVDQYLEKSNLTQYITTNSSYLVYFFKDNSLCKISLRLYYNNDTLPALLAKNLSVTYASPQTYIKNPDNYFVYENQVYNKIVEITMGLRGTESLCSGNWYSNK